MCLIYPKDFDCTSYPIGLRYNEQWHSLIPDTDVASVDFYNSEWEGRQAVAFDWAQASSQPGLSFTSNSADYPGVPIASDREAAISLDFRHIRVVLAPLPFFATDFKSYRHCQLMCEDGEQGEVECDNTWSWAEITFDKMKIITIGPDNLQERHVAMPSED